MHLMSVKKRCGFQFVLFTFLNINRTLKTDSAFTAVKRDAKF